MTDTNPYSAPEAELEHSPVGGRFTLVATPHSRFIGRGWGWIKEGFDYFRRSWGSWIGAMLLGWLILIVVTLIPIVNLLVPLLTFFVWNAGIALGCRAQAEGQAFRISHLWAGFFNRAGTLVLLSVVYYVALAVVGYLVVVLISPQLLSPEAEAIFSRDPQGAVRQVWLPVLVALALTLPVVMATLFAPHLIALHELSLLDAVRLSFIGCLKNTLPFLAWGIGFLGLFLAISMLAGLLSMGVGLFSLVALVLGLLALPPVFFASIYLAYEDIFLADRSAAAQETGSS